MASQLPEAGATGLLTSLTPTGQQAVPETFTATRHAGRRPTSLAAPSPGPRTDRSRAPDPRFRLTQRDLGVLCDLVRFGPLRVDQLAARHAFGSERAARDRLRRLVAGGLLVRYFLDTYLATGPGTRSTGLELQPPGRPGPRLPHDLAVADLAVWLLEREPGSSWVTERELRHGCGLPASMSGHVPDGKLVLASGKADAIELELHEKRADQYDRILRWFARAVIFDRFRWYVQGAAIERVLKERAARHDLTAFVSVEPVPKAVRVASWTG